MTNHGFQTRQIQRAMSFFFVLFVALFVLVWPAHGDYLGKSATQWQFELAKGADAQTKRNAAFALGKLGIQALDAVPVLLRCAQSTTEDPGVRESALYALGEIIPRGSAGPNVKQLLCQLSADSSDENVRRSALVALGRCARDTEDVRAAIDSALTDVSPAVRQNATWALGEICEKTDDLPVTSLRKGLGDRDMLVKRDAALALGKIIDHRSTVSDEEEQAEQRRLTKVRGDSRDALGDLIQCVDNNYLELRKAACATLIYLVKSEDSKAIPALSRACKDDDLEVRRNGALALAAIGGDGAAAAVPVLLETLHSGDSTLRQMAALAFRNIGAPGLAAVPQLLKTLAADKDETVRYYAAVALGGLDAAKHQVVYPLAECVANAREKMEVRVAAAMSLQNIGPCQEAIQAIPLLVNVVDDSEQPARVRERTLWALRVHEGGLAKYDALFSALTKILTEPTLRGSDPGEKMLRYDAAFLLGMFRGRDAPKEVFPVLLEYLQDDKVRIFTGLNFKTGGTAEGATAKVGVGEQGADDCRINAVRALEKIGAKRVLPQLDIIEQLCELRDTTMIVDPRVRDATTKLLKDWGVK